MDEEVVYEKKVELSAEESVVGLFLALGMGILVAMTLFSAAALLVFDGWQVFLIIDKQEPWRIALIILASGVYGVIVKLIWRALNRFGIAFLEFVYKKATGKEL